MGTTRCCVISRTRMCGSYCAIYMHWHTQNKTLLSRIVLTKSRHEWSTIAPCMWHTSSCKTAGCTIERATRCTNVTHFSVAAPPSSCFCFPRHQRPKRRIKYMFACGRDVNVFGAFFAHSIFLSLYMFYSFENVGHVGGRCECAN